MRLTPSSQPGTPAVGSSSVCYARGHEIPDWTQPDPEARPGSLAEFPVPSRALRRDCPVTLYLPARFRRADPGTRYPLLIVHDGGVVGSPGVYLMGMQFLRRRKSALIDGAGDDARDLSAHLAAYLDNAARLTA